MNGEFKSWFDAGILVRSRITNLLKGTAWKLGLEFESERAGRVIRFKVTGDATAVQRFKTAYAIWLQEMAKEGDADAT